MAAGRRGTLAALPSARGRPGQPRAPRPAPGEVPQQRRHRLYTLRKAVALPGSRCIDRRTGVGRALAEWRGELIDALGGDGQVSPQQETIIDLAVRSKLILDSIDAWLLQQPSLGRKKYRVLAPYRAPAAVGWRMLLARYMAQLGSRTPRAQGARPGHALAARSREWRPGRGAMIADDRSARVGRHVVRSSRRPPGRAGEAAGDSRA